METKIYKMSREKTRPSICISGYWLNDIGFVHDATVAIDYQQEHVCLQLVSKETAALSAKTVADNVSRLQLLRKIKAEKRKNVPCIDIGGQFLEELGFSVGCPVVFRYDYGVLHMHVLHPEGMGVERSVLMDSILTTVTRHTYCKKERTKIRLTGDWLPAMGFTKDQLMKVVYDKGRIELTVAGQGLDEYLKLKKEIMRERNSTILEMNFDAARGEVLLIKNGWLEEMGFPVGTVIRVQYRMGYIVIEAIELEKYIYNKRA
jgi:hypothetical protein